MVTLISCPIWQIISFILSPNEYDCVYASLSGPAIDLQKMPNISETSLRRILHKDLRMTPYKVQLVQELKLIEHTMRFRFAKCSCYRLTKDVDFGKKNHLFRWSSLWSWQVCKQAKLSHLEHRKPARIHWKADAYKNSHWLVRILVNRHNWAILLRKLARRGRYSHWRSLSGHVEQIFVHKN